MQSETVGELAKALAKAQGDIAPAAMDRDNPFFKSKYATLTSLWESARKAIAANGLAVTQTTELFDNGDMVLITTLMHASGEWVRGAYPIKAVGGKPQELGSAMTYARRYAFGAILGLSSDDDDDGNAASGNSKPQQSTVRQEVTHPVTVAESDKRQSATSSSNGNGQVTEKTLKRLHAVGGKLYGGEWEAKRHAIVSAKTKKRTESSKELTEVEAIALIDGMETKLHAELAAINADPFSEQVPA